MSELQAEKKGSYIHEDWVVVILAFAIILLSIIGLKLPVPLYSWSSATDLIVKILTIENLWLITLQFALVFVIIIIGTVMTGKSVRQIAFGFPIVYALTIAAIILAGNKEIKSFNLEAVIFSLSIGLLIGNLFKLPDWLRASLSTELFVKIGLVLLGTGIIFSDILKNGMFGMFQAVIVVLSVWYFAYWVCKKFKLDEEMSMMLSSAVSICGVSAAIATAGAIKGDPKKLSYIISIVLITAIPMMIVMPYIAKYFGFSQEVTGAWLGGSIDTTGAVVASGSLVGEKALEISTIVKFSQNVLLGVAAFVISVYWSFTRRTDSNVEKPTLGMIWDRFPKFVLGFLAASLMFSFFVSPQTVAGVKESLKNIQTLWFVLAFTSIGLETKFSDLFNSSSQKPLYAFLIAQLFNILITLLIAYLLFNEG